MEQKETKFPTMRALWNECRMADMKKVVFEIFFKEGLSKKKFQNTSSKLNFVWRA